MDHTSMNGGRVTYPKERTSGKVFAAIAAAFVSLSLIGGVLGLFDSQAGRGSVVALEAGRTAHVG